MPPNDDNFDDGYKKNAETSSDEALTPLNIIKKPARQTAVALKDGSAKGDMPTVKAAGRGKIAEQILQLALENDIKIRTDADLAEILAKIELDSPIPSEAMIAVAEILSYIYRANGEPNPFDAVLKDVIAQQGLSAHNPEDNQEDNPENNGPK